MVHGLGAQLVHWPPHLIHFLKAHNFRPITYDNRDVGLSSRFLGTPSFVLDYFKYFLRLPIQAEYTIDDMADDGMKLLETLEYRSSSYFRDLNGRDDCSDHQRPILLKKLNHLL